MYFQMRSRPGTEVHYSMLSQCACKIAQQRILTAAQADLALALLAVLPLPAASSASKSSLDRRIIRMRQPEAYMCGGWAEDC